MPDANDRDAAGRVAEQGDEVSLGLAVLQIGEERGAATGPERVVERGDERVGADRLLVIVIRHRRPSPPRPAASRNRSGTSAWSRCRPRSTAGAGVRTSRPILPRSAGSKGEQQRQYGVRLGLEQIDERIARLDVVSSPRRPAGYRSAPRSHRRGAACCSRDCWRAPAAQLRSCVDLIERIVAIAMLDQRIADSIGLVVIDELDAVAGAGADRAQQLAAHLGVRQLDVVDCRAAR